MTTDAVIAAVIIVNAAALTLDAFPSVHAATGGGLQAIDYACAWLFIVEMGVRLAVQKRTFFASSWNRFDLAIVLLSSPAVLAPVMDTRTFSALLILRLARLARLARVLRLFPRREHMIRGLTRALRSSAGMLAILSLMLFMAALAACMLFGQSAPDLFGTPLTALHTTFQLCTIEGWYEIENAVAATGAGAGWLATVRLFFAFVVLAGGVLGLGLLNAVMVDELVADNTNTMEARQKHMEAELLHIRRILEHMATQQKREEHPQNLFRTFQSSDHRRP